MSKIIFAGGCFWGLQSVFDNLSGIEETQVGYTGGQTENPSYQDVCNNSTGHTEAVLVRYNPEKISLSDLLDLFFMSHDPTTPNHQGNDIGSQYRSGIYYNTTTEKHQILDKIKSLAPYFSDPIITEVKKATTFWPAETYHQKYYQKHKQHPSPQIGICQEAFLKKKLTSDQYWVLRGKGTEPPFSGKYLYTDETGTYHCAACNQPLFTSKSKFSSGCGWPSFDRALPDSIKLRKDFSHFMLRDEVICSRCSSHLGHLFPDPSTKTAVRYCINSLALTFRK